MFAPKAATTSLTDFGLGLQVQLYMNLLMALSIFASSLLPLL